MKSKTLNWGVEINPTARETYEMLLKLTFQIAVHFVLILKINSGCESIYIQSKAALKLHYLRKFKCTAMRLSVSTLLSNG